MLVQIGSSKEPSDIVDLLLECHHRIRSFISLASRLAAVENNSLEEIEDAAKRVTRYFSEALPLHVADEEESILPRLTGKNTELDATLERMHREHVKHKPQIEVLVATCRAVQNAPQHLPQLRKTLQPAASWLEAEFGRHLQQEEAVILPAIRALLTREEQTEILNELRTRRG